MKIEPSEETSIDEKNNKKYLFNQQWILRALGEIKKRTLATKKKLWRLVEMIFFCFTFIYAGTLFICSHNWNSWNFKMTIFIHKIGNIHKPSVAGFRRYNIRVFHVGNVNQNGSDGSLRTRHLFSGLMEQTGFLHSDGRVCKNIFNRFRKNLVFFCKKM